MGIVDKIARKVLGEEYDSYSYTLKSMDGCQGEEFIAKVRSAIKKLIPC